MMFSGNQRIRVCKALARAAHLEHLVGEVHPTPEFFRQVESPTCSTGEWALLQLAHAVWTGSRGAGPCAGLMIFILDERSLDLVGRLLQALAAPHDRELEAWLTSAGFPRLTEAPA